jgi:hypothetical protein
MTDTEAYKEEVSKMETSTSSTTYSWRPEMQMWVATTNLAAIRIVKTSKNGIRRTNSGVTVSEVN